MAATAAEEYYDVIVVGGGIMGSCTAYNTAKRGQKTLLLEQFDFLHHRGSSHGESRTLRASYPQSHYTAMVMESVRLWEAAQSEVGFQVYFPTHQLDIGPASDPNLASIAHNCAARVLTPAQVADKFSGCVSLPDSWAAVLADIGGVIKPTKAVSMFHSLALRHGAVLTDNVEVIGIKRRDDGRIAVTSSNNRVFIGKKCVITAGPWIRKLVQAVAKEEIPIQPLETSVMYWKVKEGYEGHFAASAGFPTFSSYGDSQVFGTPSLEFPGLIKAALHTGRPCDPATRTWAPLDTSAEIIGGWIRDKFAGRVEWERPVMVQSCMYSVTPDEDYVIDFLGGVFHKDVVVAGGFSGHGFKMGPVIGRILADMVIDGSVDGVIEMGYFGLHRFKTNPKGNAH